MPSARSAQPNASDSAHVRLIKAVQTQHGWNDHELADQLGVGRSTITNWKAGRREPHPAWIRLIRDLLPVSTQPM